MPTGSQLTLGIVGYGRLAQGYYTPALREMRGVRVTCVGDPGRASRNLAARRFPHAAVGESHEHVIAHAPDAVLVASPPSTHVDIWRAAQRAGIPSFVEKPFALARQVESLQEMSDADARLMVDFNRRFWPGYQRVREWVAAGRIGALRQVDFVLHTNALQWYRAQNQDGLRAEGGVLHDLGSHSIDLTCDVIGADPIQIRAVRSVDPSERVVLKLDFRDGVRASCDLRHCDYNRETLVAIGSAGRITMRNPNAMVHVRARDAGRGPTALIGDVAALGYRFVFVKRRLLRQSIRRALDAFVASVRDHRPFEPGYAVALKNARLIARAEACLQANGNPPGGENDE